MKAVLKHSENSDVGEKTVIKLLKLNPNITVISDDARLSEAWRKALTHMEIGEDEMFCKFCGTRLVPQKQSEFDRKTGQSIFADVCPNVDNCIWACKCAGHKVRWFSFGFCTRCWDYPYGYE